MASIYTHETLRKMFQSAFQLAEWYSFLQHFFHATELKKTPESIHTPHAEEEGHYIGCIETSDYFRIGLFCYQIRKGSVANRRVGLRNLVRSFINPQWGEFDAALVVYDSHDHWRLSFICDIKEESTAPKRYTYVFGNKDLLYRTPIERLLYLQKKGISFENLKTAFSVEALSDEFFDRYREQYADFIQYVTGKRFVKAGNKWVEKVVGSPNTALMQAFGHDEKKIRDYIKKMMGRITFLHFLQRKGWMNRDLNYMQHLFERSRYQDDYLDSVLEPLFFGILNTRPLEREKLFCQYGWDKSLLAEWKDIPYLNGGLFERDADDEPESVFPADYFRRLFQFFSEYNFTIDENDPNDAEVGVDPEMLGKIFENLLEDNKDKGAFYTPKEIVRYMCQESLIAYLETHTTLAKDKVRAFVLSPEESLADIPDNKKSKLLTALEEVKICDPAIGSGAFPMGLLNALLHCREALSGERYDRAELKKQIIQRNIYGVDIEKGAVDIARLRFWLSIVVDEETPSPLPNLDYKIMQGNSLIESFMGVDLSKLTYEKENKKDKGEISLFDNEKNRLQKTVSQLLTAYYSCTDHTRKVRLQQEISATINRQLEAGLINQAILNKLKEINLAENNQFFLWHTWFSDVFNREEGKSGFDIVIGNPPYIDSETMTQLGQTELREYITHHYKYIKGNWDIYMAFLELGLTLSTCLCFITPDKWLSKPFGSKFREFCMAPRMSKIVHTGNKTFESAMVDAIITLFLKKSDSISTYKFDGNKDIIYMNTIPTSSLTKPYYIDSLFSENHHLIKKIEDGKAMLHTIAECENACSTHDAYELAPFVHNLTSNFNVTCNELKIVNTGTIDKFSNKWGVKEMTYLGAKYINPVVNRHEFHNHFGNAYVRKGMSPKLIFKGLNLLDGFIDFQGLYIPGKSTLVICSDNSDNLKFLCGLLNSRLAIFYIKSKYASSSYCGGITFTKDMINNFPIPTHSNFKNGIVKVVDKILTDGYSKNLNNNLNEIIYSGYSLSSTEIETIEQNTAK